jgi:hypothetical protein
LLTQMCLEVFFVRFVVLVLVYLFLVFYGFDQLDVVVMCK